MDLSFLSGDIHHLTHGEKVAYGIFNSTRFRRLSRRRNLRYANFFKAIELPTTLADLHLKDVAYEDLLKIGELATAEGETSHNMNPELTPEQIADAIIAVNAITTA